jgi:hypothetical protein
MLRILAGVAALAVMPAVARPPVDPLTLVRIQVAEDAPYSRAHMITIGAETDRAARSRAEIEGWTWRATREWDGGSMTISSIDCPALRDAALAFERLPDLTVMPPALRVVEGPIPLPPSRKDGYSTTLSFETITVDGSSADVTIDGGNAYSQWGHEAVSALIPCWGPLRPQP